jgi:hypothetical protein
MGMRHPTPLSRRISAAIAIEGWVTAAWLLAVEGRALIEDHEGGAEQPALRSVVAIALLELLVRVEAHMRGAIPAASEHLLALGLEHGVQEPLAISPSQLFELLAESQEADASLRKLWEEVLDAFPGTLPDPLQSSGQGEMLRALRNWSSASAAAGLDADFLGPLLKDA